MGKRIELDIEGASLDELRAQVDAMCRELLSNPVIESYDFTVE